MMTKHRFHVVQALVRCAGTVGLMLVLVAGCDWAGDNESGEAPTPPRPLTNVEKQVVDSLDTETWTRVTDRLSPQSLSRLKMPRFTLRYEKTLNDALSDLGMGVAFTDRANFRDIADTALAIDEVKHKTFLQVDEEGTEASAATSVGIEVASAPPSFVADRPFVVAIRENHAGTILFLGVVTDPAVG